MADCCEQLKRTLHELKSRIRMEPIHQEYSKKVLIEIIDRGLDSAQSNEEQDHE